MPLANILDPLLIFKEKYGVDLFVAQQGSEAWMQSKLGVLSASNAKEILSGTKTETRNTYMSSLVSQIATGIFPEVNARAMQWGKDHEDAARAAYEFATGNPISQLAFIFKDTKFRVGCSADGFVQEKKGVEIKCPWNSENFIKFLTADTIKDEWNKQVNFSLWVTGLEQWDFVQYDPRMKKNPMHMITVERDATLMIQLDDCVPQFIEDMDKMLAKAGFKFGEQWERIIVKTEKAG